MNHYPRFTLHPPGFTLHVQRFTLIFLLACTLFACGKKEVATDDAKSYIEMAEVELARDSVARGEMLLRRAIAQAEKAADWHSCYIACQRLAESLSWSNSEEALRWARQALAVYEQHPDDERNHVMLLDFVGTYAAQLAYNTDGPLDEALSVTLQAHQLAVKGKMADLICQTNTSLANIYWAMDDYQRALGYAREAARTATPELLQGALQVLGRCYLSCDSVAQAEAVYRRMEPGDDVHAAYIIYSNLAKIALKKNRVADAETAVDSAFEQAEELYFKALEQKDNYYQTTMQQVSEHERQTYQQALYRRTLTGVVVALAVLLLVVFFALRYRLQLLRQRRAFEAARFERESAAQRQQLQQLEDVAEFLRNYIVERSEVVKKLSKSNNMHVSLNPSEWADVERMLNAIDNDRFARLRQQYPDLREEDIQLCILTRLQLSNRAIGNIYGLTVSAVQHRKLKLKKDIFCVSDPDTTLEQVIDREGDMAKTTFDY